jgi:hypothetical protein
MTLRLTIRLLSLRIMLIGKVCLLRLREYKDKEIMKYLNISLEILQLLTEV